MNKNNLNPLKNFQYDFPAALVVFLVALPLCLGVALGSKVAPFSGIIAGVVGGIVVGLLSKSSLSVSGPAAGLTVLVASAVEQFPVFETFLLTVFLAGVFQILLGFLRAGVIGSFIPNSAIRGMLAAIGIMLILKQIPHAFGKDMDYEGDFFFHQIDGENTFSEIFHLFDAQYSVGAIFIALSALFFLFAWERVTGWLKLVPGPLIVVIGSILINQIYRGAVPVLTLEKEHLVELPVASTMKEFFGFFRFVSFAEIGNPAVWKTAFTLGLVATIETLLSIEAVDKLDPYKRVSPTNRELMAQGVGNMLSGLIGGIPVTSVIVRSSANVNSGARTNASTVIHGVLLLLCVALIPGLLNMIPKSALAAILIATGYKLTKPELFIKKWKKGLAHFVPFCVTVIAILLTDLLVGVCIGVLVSSFFIILGNFKSSISVVSEGQNYLVRIKKDLSFIHKFELKRVLASIPSDTDVIINLTKVGFVDLDNVEIIADFIENAAFRNIKVQLKTTEGQSIEQNFINDFNLYEHIIH